MKTYLFPPILRKGQPANTFISRERIGEEVTYWLCTEHQLMRGRYQRTTKVAISRTLYARMNVEARHNHRRYVPKSRES